jgi:DNA-binding MarR family transcriptional regulator
MPPETNSSAAADAWRTIMALVGWGPGRGPHFPAVAVAFDLSPKQLAMLWRLEPSGDGLPMRSIAESLYCDASYVTDMVDKLEQRGLIERRADHGDRRVKLLALTDAGIELRSRALKMLYEPPEEFDRLSDAEAETLARLLAKTLGDEA